MKKITVLVAQRYVDEALLKLRKLGVVHIKHLKEPEGKEIYSLKEELRYTELALGALAERPSLKEETVGNIQIFIKETVALIKEKEQLLQKKDYLQTQINWFKEWGKVSLASLEELKQNGVFVKLYIVGKKLFKRIAPDRHVFVVKEERNKVYIAFITFDITESLGFGEVELPKEDFFSIERELNYIEMRLSAIEERLNALACYREGFKKHMLYLTKQIEFYAVRSGMGKGEGFWYLQGFMPAEDVHTLKGLAKKEGWAVLAEEPDDSCSVPTLIRNPRWVRIIEPVFKFMGAFPGYNEYDISMWFLVFLTIFFAILIGDAGYGMLFIVATFFAQKRFKKAPSEIFSLIYVFSIATIIWGVCSGNYFGVERISSLPFLRTLVIEKINSFADTSQQFMIYLCFLIGAIHLTVAHIIRAFRFRKSLIALSQLGWICAIWGLFFVANTFVIGEPFTYLGGYLLAIGVVFIFFFSYPNRNIFKAVGQSLMDAPLKVIGSFGDVVSYLRLFAVGYATVIVASSFNDMALSLGFSSIIRSFGAAVIIFLGHSLNIVLGVMAIIVHGVRLNMLEFSGHLGMEWSGVPYQPFKE